MPDTLRGGEAPYEPLIWPVLLTVVGTAAALLTVAGSAATIQETAALWLAVLYLDMAIAGATGMRRWTARSLIVIVLSIVVASIMGRFLPVVFLASIRVQLTVILVIGLFGVTLYLWLVYRSLIPTTLASLIALAVAGAVYVMPQPSTVPARQGSPPVPLPLDLRSRQTTGMAAQLTWSPVAGATAYIVSVGHYTLTSTRTSVIVRDRLVPGQAYGWRVRARLPSGPGLVSPPAHLEIRPQPATIWHFAASSAATSSIATIYNTAAGPAHVTLAGSLPGVRSHYTVAAHGGTQIILPPVFPAVQFISDQPIILTRVITLGQTVRSSYGVPGPLQR